MPKLNASMSSNDMIGILSENNYNVSNILIRVRNFVGDNDEYKKLLMLLDSNFYTPDQIIKLWLAISKADLEIFISNVRRLEDPEEAKKIIKEIRFTSGMYSYFD
jgi:hypothetical protein